MNSIDFHLVPVLLCYTIFFSSFRCLFFKTVFQKRSDQYFYSKKAETYSLFQSLNFKRCSVHIEFGFYGSFEALHFRMYVFFLFDLISHLCVVLWQPSSITFVPSSFF